MSQSLPFFIQYHQNKAPRWKLAPTRREQDKWDRATKAATGGSVSFILQMMIVLFIGWLDLHTFSLESLIRIVNHRETFLVLDFFCFVW